MNKGIKINTTIIKLSEIYNTLNYGQIYTSLEILEASYISLLEAVEEMRDMLKTLESKNDIDEVKNNIAILQLQAGYAETNVLVLKEALELKENKLVINYEIGDVEINYSLN